MNSGNNRGGAGRQSPAASQEENMRVLQFKEMQHFVTKTVKVCFSQCINDFTADKMSADEKKCLDSCIMRTMNIQTEIDQLLPQIDEKFKDV